MLSRNKKRMIIIAAGFLIIFTSIFAVSRVISSRNNDNVTRIQEFFQRDMQCSIHEVFELQGMVGTRDRCGKYVVIVKPDVPLSQEDKRIAAEIMALWKDIPHMKNVREGNAGELFTRDINYLGIETSASFQKKRSQEEVHGVFVLYIDPQTRHIFVQKQTDIYEWIPEEETYVEYQPSEKTEALIGDILVQAGLGK